MTNSLKRHLEKEYVNYYPSFISVHSEATKSCIECTYFIIVQCAFMVSLTTASGVIVGMMKGRGADQKVNSLKNQP